VVVDVVLEDAPSSASRSTPTAASRAHVRTATNPTDDRKPAWRRACLAYREMRQAGASDQEAHEAAVAAVQTVLPISWKEASAEAVNAIAYATRYQSEWFWQGAQHVGKWRRFH